MKTQIIIVLFSILSVSLCEGCSKYKCLDSSQVADDSICSIVDVGANTYSVRACPPGFKCSGIAFIDSLYCQNTYSLRNIGEKCIRNEECKTGVCSKDKKCIGASDGQACLSHSACDNNSYCSLLKDLKNQCASYKNPGDSCIISYQCPYGYVCGANSTKFFTSGTCMRMYSVENGQTASEDKLCQSGLRDSDGVCYDTDYPEGSGREPNTCKQDSDCLLQRIRGETKDTINGECVCSMNGNSYCQYPTKSSEYQNFLKVFKKEVEKFKAGSLNVAEARKSSSLLNANIKEAQFEKDVKYFNIPSCVYDYAFNSGNMMKVSYYLIALVLAFLF